MNYGLMNDDEFLNDLAVKICAAALLLCLSLSPLSALGRQELGPGQGAGETVRVEAEDEETVPVLVSGPEAGKGLPFLSANAIEHYRGLYETASGRIFVYYTEKEIVALSSWEEASCEGRALRRFRADALAFPSVQPAEDRAELLSEGVLVAFYRSEDFSLFFLHEGAEVACGFIDDFIRQLIFFRSTRGDSGGAASDGAAADSSFAGGRTLPPPFPAVLDD